MDLSMNQTDWMRCMSPKEWALFGMQDIAYAKKVMVNGVVEYAVHAADGTQIANMPSRAVAAATLAQHDIDVLSVH